jgi:hypothetical protein
MWIERAVRDYTAARENLAKADIQPAERTIALACLAQASAALAQAEMLTTQGDMLSMCAKALLASRTGDAMANRELSEALDEFNMTAPHLAEKLKGFGDRFGS